MKYSYFLLNTQYFLLKLRQIRKIRFHASEGINADCQKGKSNQKLSANCCPFYRVLPAIFGGNKDISDQIYRSRNRIERHYFLGEIMIFKHFCGINNGIDEQ